MYHNLDCHGSFLKNIYVLRTVINGLAHTSSRVHIAARAQLALERQLSLNSSTLKVENTLKLRKGERKREKNI